MTDTDRRVALIADAGFYVGPALSRLMAERGHDLVLGDPKPELVEELTGVTTVSRVIQQLQKRADQAKQTAEALREAQAYLATQEFHVEEVAL